ncbi:MAG: hypothetical protein H7A49_11165 [Akkermansiaceae bacterium]|nr:hypothetical protein [Akkermansiaceae bacterium]MCP5548367.1 hypothetical protein [Akkermansiaceae bacterium]
MHPVFQTALAAVIASPVPAAERSGKAEASWLSAASHYQAGEPLRTAIRLAADSGWHTYWDNPGEGGMPTSITLHLPDGWKAGEIGRPAPVRFLTGDLPGFGYEGEVLFPVELTPPAGASGEMTAKAELSWLACSDDACIPGEATVELKLSPGKPGTTTDADRIGKAEKQVPETVEGVSLDVTADSHPLVLSVRSTRDGFDPAECSVFPLEFGVVDAGADLHFAKSGDGRWRAEVPASEYADAPPASLTLVFVPEDGTKPLRVAWTK